MREELSFTDGRICIKCNLSPRSKRLREMTDALGGMLKPLPTSASSGMGIDTLRRTLEEELATAFK